MQPVARVVARVEALGIERIPQRAVEVDDPVGVAAAADPRVDLAAQRAVPSAKRLGVRVLHSHAETLHDARNAGLADVDTEWVCHVDADDELEAGYFDVMGQANADLRAPSVRYIRRGRSFSAPQMPKVSGHVHDCEAACLRDGNWLLIGTVVRTDLLRRAGGWWDYPWSEDWSVWLRCFLLGATVEAVPQAVYRAHVRPGSRNRAPDRAFKVATHHRIVADATARASGQEVPA